MKIGVFHPGINNCGGSDWVAIKTIQSLNEHGHQVIILTDSKLNPNRFSQIFNTEVKVDREIIFPLPFSPFSPGDWHNVYFDYIRTKMLKSKCDVLIDTYSNSILSENYIVYFHYPILRALKEDFPYIKNSIYYSLHRQLIKSSKEKATDQLLFANSEFTKKAIEKEFNVTPHVLYPPVSNYLLDRNRIQSNPERKNTVLTISRFDPDKNLEIIPHIAKRSHNSTSFIIAGLLNSKKTLMSLRRLIKDLDVESKVTLIPDISRTSLRNILFDCKVYLHTKVNEHFGIAIIEAMASGCLPIVHNSGGPKEFVPSKFRFDTIEEAANKIDGAIESWSLTESKRTSESTEKFSESNFSKHFFEIFNSYYG
ncbi:MAG: glycosyltransferase [Candidatus Thermoplasmatota archaeon]|nr:glycosyltransferase [Candidatus Thermoplasmatota archaeon]